MERRRLALLAAALAGVGAVALSARWPALPVASALGDAAGPYWSGARSTPWPPPHAAIYGGALALPHRAVLWGAASLWQAFAALFALQALVAPVAAALAWRWSGRLLPAVVVGLLAAVDPGLLDTTTSGAKAYLAPLLLGATALAAAPGARAAPLAPVLLALAVANHPLAVCAAPLLALLPRDRRTLAGAAVGALLVAPQALRLLGAEAGGGAPGAAAPAAALSAWWTTQGPTGAAIAGGAFLGLTSRRTRPLAAAVLASLALLLLAGGGLGYLRDHHLRLLTLPALAGLGALPGWAALLPLVLLRPPDDPVSRPAEARRPGTLGLETRIADALATLPDDRLVVDGVWISGAPAAEPGALLLDLWLRGWPEERLAPGGRVALVVTAERPHLAALPPLGALEPVLRDDRLVVLVGRPADTRAWVAAVCADAALPAPRVGGAWDGLAVLHPDLGAEVGEAWAAPCLAP